MDASRGALRLASRRIAMNVVPGIAVVSLLTGLAGCTGAETKSAYVAPTSVQKNTIPELQTRPDAQYISQVEHLARERRVRVYWVNPPAQRVSVASH
jgi:hypothetical protein